MENAEPIVSVADEDAMDCGAENTCVASRPASPASLASAADAPAAAAADEQGDADTFVHGVLTIKKGAATVDAGSHSGGTDIVEVRLSDTVTEIQGGDPGAFDGCSCITTVHLPDGLTTIGARAFKGCTGLATLDLPDGLTTIGDEAFSDCTGITTLHVPDSVTAIGTRAFNRCTGITTVHLPAGLTTLGMAAFYGCTGITTVHLPAGLTAIGGATFIGCTGITTVHLPTGLTAIGRQAFDGCTGITTVHLPAGLTALDMAAFIGCTGITTVHLPDHLTTIGSSPFRDCTGITTVHVPSSVTDFNPRVFSMSTKSNGMPFARTTRLVTTNPIMLEFVLQQPFAMGHRKLLQGLDMDHPKFKEQAAHWLRPYFKRDDEDLQSRLQKVREQRQQQSGSKADPPAPTPSGSTTPCEDFAALDELLNTGGNAKANLCGDWSALDFAIDWAEEGAFKWLLEKEYVDVDQLSATHRTVLNARASARPAINKWGVEYGAFLGRYMMEDGAPKHVSATCCVVFAKDLMAADSFTVQTAGSASPSSRKSYSTIKGLFSAHQWSLEDADKVEAVWAAVKNHTPLDGVAITATKHDRVVLKFMHDSAAFGREIESRKTANLEKSDSVISILAAYKPTVPTDSNGTKENISNVRDGCADGVGDDDSDGGHVDAGPVKNDGNAQNIPSALKMFPLIRLSTEEADCSTVLDHLLVMERGSTDLSDAISHGDLAGRNMPRIRGIAISAAECLLEMNSKGVIHGDVKSRNFVLLPSTKYAAIDLDAAARIDLDKAGRLGTLAPSDPQAAAAWQQYLAGQKQTSSGCLPPEQARVVLHRLRRATGIFKHLLAKAGGAEKELGRSEFAAFCGDIGLATPHAPDSAAIMRKVDADANDRVSLREFRAHFADPEHDDVLAKYYEEHGVGGALSDANAAAEHRLKEELQTAIATANWDQAGSISNQIKAMKAAQSSQAPRAVAASQAYDMWGFGVMLFELATGTTLFRIDVREEAVNDEELAKIAEWSNADKSLALDGVEDTALRHLLGQLLDADPHSRPKGWGDIIAALEAGGDMATVLAALKATEEGVKAVKHGVEAVADQVTALADQLALSHKQLTKQITEEGAATRNLMLDLQKVQVPYVFEIVKVASAKDIAKGRAKEAAADQRAAVVEDAEAEAADLSAALKTRDYETRSKNFLQKRLAQAKRLYKDARAAAKNPAKFAADLVQNNASQKMELRLLCGVTLGVVVTYEIPVVDEEMAKHAATGSKIMGTCLKIAAGWNCVAGAARIFGVPAPAIPGCTTDHGKDVKAFLDDLQQGNDEVDALQANQAEGAGMNVAQLDEFAAYVDRLIKDKCGPDWRGKMQRVEDKAIPGRVTFADSKCPECGIYGAQADTQSGDGNAQAGGSAAAGVASAGGEGDQAATASAVTAGAANHHVAADQAVDDKAGKGLLGISRHAAAGGAGGAMPPERPVAAVDPAVGSAPALGARSSQAEVLASLAAQMEAVRVALSSQVQENKSTLVKLQEDVRQQPLTKKTVICAVM